MLMSGMGEALSISSNTMCGVFEESSPWVARARRRISSSMYAARPSRSPEPMSFSTLARSMLLMSSGG